jgi:hypothetical protein
MSLKAVAPASSSKGRCMTTPSMVGASLTAPWSVPPLSVEAGSPVTSSVALGALASSRKATRSWVVLLPTPSTAVTFRVYSSVGSAS